MVLFTQNSTEEKNNLECEIKHKHGESLYLLRQCIGSVHKWFIQASQVYECIIASVLHMKKLMFRAVKVQAKVTSLRVAEQNLNLVSSSLNTVEHSMLCYCHLIIKWNLMPCYLHGAWCPFLHYGSRTVPRHPLLCEFGRDTAFISYLILKISMRSIKQKVLLKIKILESFLDLSWGAQGRVSVTHTKK